MIDHRALIEQLFARIDARDAEGFAACFAEQASFQLANNPAACGRAAIQEFAAGFFAAIGGIRHQLDNCWSRDDQAFSNGLVTYVRKDGSELTVPWATLSRFEGGKVADHRVYADASRLFNP
jgi:ketosteroid isomerase-like protein